MKTITQSNTQPKLVYVGCGHHRMNGFLHVEKNVYKHKAGLPEILADITVKIPLADNSVDLVYSRNTLEHLTYRELINHLLECQRMLKTGGYIRMVVPNFDMWINEYEHQMYRDDREYNPDLPNENYTETFIANVLYHDHYYLHNFSTLKSALEKTGFTQIRQCEPGETKITVASPEFLKAEIRKHEFLIIEAEKSGDKPFVKAFPRPYPKNILHKILCKYFNIKIVPFTRQCPIFPSRWWFMEKIAQFKQNRKPLDDVKGATIKPKAKPSYENKLDLRI